MIPLKNVLLINGVSSAATGVGLVAFPKLMSDIFQIDQQSIFIETGIFLIGFAVLVLSSAMQPTIKARAVKIITAMDIGWTIASFILVLSYNKDISVVGNFLIIIIALWVAAMAFLQSRGLKQISL